MQHQNRRNTQLTQATGVASQHLTQDQQLPNITIQTNLHSAQVNPRALTPAHTLTHPHPTNTSTDCFCSDGCLFECVLALHTHEITNQGGPVCEGPARPLDNTGRSSARPQTHPSSSRHKLRAALLVQSLHCDSLGQCRPWNNDYRPCYLPHHVPGMWACAYWHVAVGVGVRDCDCPWRR